MKRDENRSQGKPRKSKDGSFTRNNNKIFFGYKGHSIVDDNQHVPIIQSYLVSTAKDHGTKIVLSKLRFTV